MGAFLYGVGLQWKLDLRNKGILLTYYVVPLIFFGFMGAIFTSINPMAKDTLIQTMSIFGVSMGALIGAPTPLVEMYGSDIKKAYKVGGIPLWTPAANNFLSAFLHLFIMTLVIFFIAPIAFNAKVPDNTLVFMLSLAFFIIVSLSVGTALGLVIKSISKLTMLAQLIFLPSIMLSGAMFPATMLPDVLQAAGKIVPATWALIIMTSDAPTIGMILPMVLMLIVMLVVSAWALNSLKNE